MTAPLSCRDLTFRYGPEGRPVFEKLNLEVGSGECVLLMGPSGCGKSTLAYCLAGLYPEYGGEITGGQALCGDSPVTGLPANRRAGRVSILFQNPDDQFCMDRVEREILFALENINYAGDLRARAGELLALVGLEDLAEARLTTLSGGTKQKVALASALATDPQVLILDEPFANIDPEASVELASKLYGLKRDRGLSLLVVDHRVDYWRDMADRIIVLDGGGRPRTSGLRPADLPGQRQLFAELGLFHGGYGHTAPVEVPGTGDAVTAEGLSCGYGKTTVLRDLSFHIPRGAITAILGPNGGGKSTLLWALAGLIKYRGELRVDGPVGLVFQNPGYQFLTGRVLDEVCQTLRVGGGSAQTDELEREALSWLEEFQLQDYADASPYTLSQGQQRRLAVLSMLAGEQRLLLLDEPTYAQDERATRFIMDLLAQRVAGGLTAVITTHDPALAEAYAANIFVLEDGCLRARERGRTRWIS